MLMPLSTRYKCLRLCSIAVRRHHDYGNSYEIKPVVGTGFAVHYPLNREHGSTQADTGLEFSVCIHRHKEEGVRLGLAYTLETSELTPQ